MADEQNDIELNPKTDENSLVGPPNRARQSERARLRATALINRRLAKGVHRPFLQSMHRFQGSMTALRQLHEKLTPTVANWPDEIMDDFRDAIQRYPAEQKKALLKLAAEAIPGLIKGTLTFSATDESEGEDSERDAKKEDKVADAWRLVAEQMDGDMGAAYEVLHLLYLKSTTPELDQTFHRSLLVSAVAALDVLLLELIRELLSPSSRGSGK